MITRQLGTRWAVRVASFAEEGSPFNKVVGLGFGGVPGAAALDEIERAFAACGAPVQIELAHLADKRPGADCAIGAEMAPPIAQPTRQVRWRSRQPDTLNRDVPQLSRSA